MKSLAFLLVLGGFRKPLDSGAWQLIQCEPHGIGKLLFKRDERPEKSRRSRNSQPQSVGWARPTKNGEQIKKRKTVIGIWELESGSWELGASKRGRNAKYQNKSQAGKALECLCGCVCAGVPVCVCGVWWVIILSLTRQKQKPLPLSLFLLLLFPAFIVVVSQRLWKAVTLREKRGIRPWNRVKY